jgi:hypothetical protein
MSTLEDRLSAISRPRFPPSNLSSASILVTVEVVRPGVWLVRSSDDRFGGTFLCPKAAQKFAREEAKAVPHAIMLVKGGDIAVRQQSSDRTAVWAAGEGLERIAEVKKVIEVAEGRQKQEAA